MVALLEEAEEGLADLIRCHSRFEGIIAYPLEADSAGTARHEAGVAA